MQTTTASMGLFQRVGLLALLGVGLVIFSGPILAVLSVALSIGTVILTFAGIGFLVWLPYRMVTAGPETTGRNLRDAWHTTRQRTVWLVQGAGRVASAPLRFARSVIAGAGQAVAYVARKGFAVTRFGVELALAAAFGGVIGAATGLALSGQEPAEAIPLNAIAGAALAAGAVTCSRFLSSKPRTNSVVARV